MKYKLLAQLYEDASSTRSRLEKISIIAKFLKKIKPTEVEVIFLLLGDIYPEYDERKTGISERLAIKSIAKSTGNDIKIVEQKWKKIGDLGEVAELLTKTKTQVTLHSHILTINKILEEFRKLPELVGSGTVSKKIAIITGLLSSATPIEAKYLTRTLIGDLRIGVKEGTLRESMAEAFFTRSKENGEIIQRAIDKSNDLCTVLKICQKKKLALLEKVELEVGKPIKAMLAGKVTSVAEGFKELGKPCCLEYKYDGFRMIIHKQGNEVTLFTRMLENVTKQFPEVSDYIIKYVKADTVIIDGEAVGFDRKTKEYTDFQKISQRIRRKHNIEELRKKLPVELNIFDILYYNGQSQLDEPQKKRSELLRKIITKKKYKIVTSKQLITGDEKKAEAFYKKALKDSQEGVMFKCMKAEYKPGRRVGHMLKLKPDERDLDLVITGAEWGTGKRSKWLASFTLSCKGKKRGEYLEVGKVGTGIKEKGKDGLTFNELTKLLTPLITKEKKKNIQVKPKIVVAVTYQEIQKSQNYKSGWALRFPRITALRVGDKLLGEINTIEDIKEDFLSQKRNWKYG